MADHLSGNFCAMKYQLYRRKFCDINTEIIPNCQINSPNTAHYATLFFPHLLMRIASRFAMKKLAEAMKKLHSM